MSNLINILKNINSLSSKSKFYKRFMIDGSHVGLIRPEVSEQLLKYPDVFTVTSDEVFFTTDLNNYQKRTKAMENVLRELKNEGVFPTLKGWRSECYEVRSNFDTTPFLKMDRCSTCLFGIKTYGINVNGYVKHPTMGLCVWLQKRSLTKQRWPGVWDIMVGGGITVGQEVLETVYRESIEEASVPLEYHKNITSVGTVSYFYESDDGIFPNTAFVFDLLLPHSFEPKNVDGEVDIFRLVPVHEYLDILGSGQFKKPSVLVAVDFLIRHSVITPYENPYYISIVELLHTNLQILYEK